MTTSTLPTSDQLADATWAEMLPHFDSLAARPLSNDSAEEWLRDWSSLVERIDDAAAHAEVDYTCDTADAAKEERNRRFVGEIMPRVQEQHVRLASRLIDLGYSRPDLETFVRRARNQRALYRAKNVELSGEDKRLQSDYQKLTGGMTVEWDGREVPLPRLQPYLQEQDRELRERAFRFGATPYVEKRLELAALFDSMLAVRQRIAHNAGFENYRDFAHRSKHRFDYSPADCERFHDAVAEAVVPRLADVREARRRELGLETLRPWDLAVDTSGLPPLHPFSDAGELIAGSERMFASLDPELSAYFKIMASEGLLDLESRLGKAPGGYCIEFSASRRPFIFMNAVGVHNDVVTLLHEAGHCFHGFESSRLELDFQRHIGAEIAEVASMSMELLAAPYLERSRGGFYSPEDAARARIDHLRSVLGSLAHIASIDAFQHWVYTHVEGADRDRRDEAWLEIRARFDPVVDWSGLREQRVARWYSQIHLFCYPFYYIEYGIAQLGALQVWRNSLRDPARALADYRSALALGSTRPLPELYAAAGARLVFDREGMGELVGLVSEELRRLGA